MHWHIANIRRDVQAARIGHWVGCNQQHRSTRFQYDPQYNREGQEALEFCKRCLRRKTKRGIAALGGAESYVRSLGALPGPKGGNPAQGPSALDPRSGSIFLGGLSISSIYRRFIVAFFGPQIDEILSIYPRYIDDISTIYELHVTVLFTHGVQGAPRGPCLNGSITQCSLY